MADPYNPYSTYPTPAPGGVGYYPPEEHVQQPAYPYQQPYDNYSNTELQPPPNYNYNAQSNPQHLGPNTYQNGAQERSYTPSGQPDHLGPVTTGIPPQQGGKTAENMGYYGGHPEQQPRYTSSPGPNPPAVHVSEASQYDEEGRPLEAGDGETDRGLGSSLAGGAAGYYFGHKKEHGLIGAIGGALVANFLEDKVKNHHESSSGKHEQGHGSEHEHGHGHHGHHHHHHHSRSRSHSRNRGDDDDY
ncbi:hypothetical protein N7466_011185 [Penicillium verhagenii]|uniref:uncharacterized protein n=1 Tax=Penicillium verhagenii TaxID=1562060 RepID=UPI0025459B9E|nr:uncharacterized protein N7466_011185 [Penicillium verhagenii]KAJ5917631.1 hypothetical protein N7466_011185 [Penicillium verhagenii]